MLHKIVRMIIVLQRLESQQLLIIAVVLRLHKVMQVRRIRIQPIAQRHSAPQTLRRGSLPTPVTASRATSSFATTPKAFATAARYRPHLHAAASLRGMRRRIVPNRHPMVAMPVPRSDLFPATAAPPKAFGASTPARARVGSRSVRRWRACVVIGNGWTCPIRVWRRLSVPELSAGARLGGRCSRIVTTHGIFHRRPLPLHAEAFDALEPAASSSQASGAGSAPSTQVPATGRQRECVETRSGVPLRPRGNAKEHRRGAPGCPLSAASGLTRHRSPSPMQA